MWDDGAEGQKAHYILEFAGHQKDVKGFAPMKPFNEKIRWLLFCKVNFSYQK